MKKPIQAVFVVTVLFTFLLVGCATSQSSTDKQVEPSTIRLSTTNEYAEILSLRTEGYYSLTLRDFNTAVKAKIDGDANFLSTFSALMETTMPQDENYQFVYETLNYSISEIINTQMGTPIARSQYLKKGEGEYAGNGGETFYTFMFTSLYSVEYRVNNETGLTVQERDELLNTYKSELQNAVSAMNKDQLTASAIKSELQKIADDLCTKLSTDALVFENTEIQSMEILDGAQEYQR